jgi:hypothetical protein
MPRLALIALLFLFAITPELAAQTLGASPRPAVVVRSYGHTSSAEEFTVAAGLAGTILGQAGLGPHAASLSLTRLQLTRHAP